MFLYRINQKLLDVPGVHRANRRLLSLLEFLTLVLVLATGIDSLLPGLSSRRTASPFDVCTIRFEAIDTKAPLGLSP